MKINIKNLIIAREGLLGLDPDAFDMETYRKLDKAGHLATFNSLDDCGTVGCALGWCPFIVGLEPQSEDFTTHSQRYLSFELYTERVFGIEENSQLWDYLFSGTWARKDNSLEGLIQRMTNVIEGKIKRSNIV